MGRLSSLVHRKPDISKRAAPDRSGREIVDLKAHYGHDIRTTVYFYNSSLVLAAPLTGTPGNMQAELEAPLTEQEPVEDERLGYIVLDALLRYRSTPVPSLRDHNRSDWVTYKASGAKSLRTFNSKTCAVSIETFGGMLRLEAGRMLPEDSVFAVRAFAPVSIKHSELGQMLRKLVVGANALSEAGVV